MWHLQRFSLILLLAAAMVLAGCALPAQGTGQPFVAAPGSAPGSSGNTQPGSATGGSNALAATPAAAGATPEVTVVTSNGETQSLTNPAQPPQTSASQNAAQPALSSGPGTSPSSNSTGQAGSTTSKSAEPDGATTSIVRDATYHFQLAVPASYHVEQLNAAQLAQLTPTPVAAWNYRDAAGSTNPLAPPALAVRVYAGKGATLEQWLNQHGLNSQGGWIVEPFASGHLTGLKVSSSNFIAPGWSIYTASGDWIYQLTPGGSNAEALLGTFAVAN